MRRCTPEPLGHSTPFINEPPPRRKLVVKGWEAGSHNVIHINSCFLTKSCCGNNCIWVSSLSNEFTSTTVYCSNPQSITVSLVFSNFWYMQHEDSRSLSPASHRVNSNPCLIHGSEIIGECQKRRITRSCRLRGMSIRSEPWQGSRLGE